MKIGIITHYFKSPNYGGNLQACALVNFLQREGYDAEQICYDIFFERKKKVFNKWSLFKKIKGILIFAIVFVRKFFLRKKNKFVNDRVCERFSCILNFNQNIIPHSVLFYGLDDITCANAIYDVLITGSDQVWHPNNFCPAYLLTFAEEGKKKISYAASIAKENLSDDEITTLANAIENYTAISVRETDSVALLKRYVKKEISCVVDPVFLLSPAEWNDIALSYPINEPYLLTYFLGDNVVSRALAVAFAKEKKLKLISMPYLNGSYRKCDWNYGDKQVFDAGPDHFISLVKNASCIFTDSFHAMAFSVLFDSKFFVFPRNPKNTKEMSNRIESLLCQCHGERLFCNTNERLCLSYLIENFDKQHLDKSDLQTNILFSKNFLLSALRCNHN